MALCARWGRISNSLLTLLVVSEIPSLRATTVVPRQFRKRTRLSSFHLDNDVIFQQFQFVLFALIQNVSECCSWINTYFPVASPLGAKLGPQDWALFILHPQQLRVLLQAVLNKMRGRNLMLFCFVSFLRNLVEMISCLTRFFWLSFACCLECCRYHDPAPAQTETSIISQDNFWQSPVFYSSWKEELKNQSQEISPQRDVQTASARTFWFKNVWFVWWRSRNIEI